MMGLKPGSPSRALKTPTPGLCAWGWQARAWADRRALETEVEEVELRHGGWGWGGRLSELASVCQSASHLPAGTGVHAVGNPPVVCRWAGKKFGRHCSSRIRASSARKKSAKGKREQGHWHLQARPGWGQPTWGLGPSGSVGGGARSKKANEGCRKRKGRPHHPNAQCTGRDMQPWDHPPKCLQLWARPGELGLGPGIGDPPGPAHTRPH